MVEEATKHWHAEIEINLRPDLTGVHFEIRSYMNHTYKRVSFLLKGGGESKIKYINGI